MEYNPQGIETKWQKFWDENNCFEPQDDKTKEKKFINLKPGQNIKFIFNPAPSLKFGTKEIDCHSLIICIDGIFGAGEQFSKAPFVILPYPF